MFSDIKSTFHILKKVKESLTGQVWPRGFVNELSGSTNFWKSG